MDGTTTLPEFDQEMKNTRRMLEAVPGDCLDYRPHAKSWTMRELATHITNIPVWTGVTFNTDELDLSQPFTLPFRENMDEILAAFDAAVAEARPVLEGASAEAFGALWTLRAGDRVFFTMPKGAVFRSFVMNHIIHHRAQLGVYIRMCDAPVPGMYGPTADESM